MVSLTRKVEIKTCNIFKSHLTSNRWCQHISLTSKVNLYYHAHYDYNEHENYCIGCNLWHCTCIGKTKEPHKFPGTVFQNSVMLKGQTMSKKIIYQPVSTPDALTKSI